MIGNDSSSYFYHQDEKKNDELFGHRHLPGRRRHRPSRSRPPAAPADAAVAFASAASAKASAYSAAPAEALVLSSSSR